jgi:hypothetical protein
MKRLDESHDPVTEAEEIDGQSFIGWCVIALFVVFIGLLAGLIFF